MKDGERDKDNQRGSQRGRERCNHDERRQKEKEIIIPLSTYSVRC